MPGVSLEFHDFKQRPGGDWGVERNLSKTLLTESLGNCPTANGLIRRLCLSPPVFCPLFSTARLFWVFCLTTSGAEADQNMHFSQFPVRDHRLVLLPLILVFLRSPMVRFLGIALKYFVIPNHLQARLHQAMGFCCMLRRRFPKKTRKNILKPPPEHQTNLGLFEHLKVK